MVSSLLLWLLLEPIDFLLNNTTLSLSLNINSRCFVCLQLVRNIGFFGRLWWLWCIELLDVTFGIIGLDGWDLICFQLLKVELLDEIRWSEGMLAFGT